MMDKEQTKSAFKAQGGAIATVARFANEIAEQNAKLRALGAVVN